MGFDLASMPDSMRRCIAPEERRDMGKAARTFDDVVAEAEVKSERELQRQICGYLATRDIEVCCPSTVKRTTIKLGWPDMTFCYRGYAVVWEVKTRFGKLRPEQERIAPRLVANGWHHAVIRSLEAAKRFLDDLDALSLK